MTCRLRREIEKVRCFLLNENIIDEPQKIAMQMLDKMEQTSMTQKQLAEKMN